MAAKRRFRNKKVRYVAIGAAVTSGAAVAAVLLPSANAADIDKTPEEIMSMCHRSAKINGQQRSTRDFNGGLGDGFAADTCDFRETNFETFDGPTEKVTIDFPNCAPDVDPNASADTTWKTTVGQGRGKYTVTQQGGGAGIFGFLNASWLRHKATLDMTLESATASESTNRKIPEGKVLHVEFTPKMQRMTGTWVVKINAREQGTVLPAVPEQIFEAEEVVEGPVIRPGAAGAPGVVDGVIESVLTDC
ncbi:hypothetical protein [Streptomyces sp. NPDC018693]|uniref:hypothetical protein n=1 Tax=unclassified Streptomyces TaxID=2593676 RepID=UPI0037BDBB08